MERWILYALILMLFAGITSIIAKFGMKNVPSDTALVIRTSAVFLLVWINAFLFKHSGKFSALTRKDIFYLCLSGLTTTVSWIFYYRAIKEGNVSVVATIDKASIIVTLVLAILIFKEPFTWQVGVAGLLITTGLIILIYK
jgi:bacterial/archaeal transporter family protein